MPFPFFNMWSGSPRFLPIVEEVWQTNVDGSCMFRVVQKWKTLKHRQLNKESYHDIEMQADRAKDVLLELQGL